MLVKGLVTTVLYSSGRTGKLERGKQLSSQFKGNGVCSFPLAKSTLHQTLETFLCDLLQYSIWAQYFHLLTFFFHWKYY